MKADTRLKNSYDQETLTSLHGALLEILLAIDKVCHDYGISYWLDSGSALGAVRHKGFIPWDDDADIGMMRDDYEKFMRIAPDALGANFVVLNPLTEDRLACFFGKVCLAGTVFETKETRDASLRMGIYVDIFPYDRLHENPNIAKKQIRRGAFLQKLSYLTHSSHVSTFEKNSTINILSRPLFILTHKTLKLFCSHKFIYEKYMKNFELSRDSKSTSFADLTYQTLRVFDKDMFENLSIAEFEGHKFPIPGSTIEYLECLYGTTWNELPPIEQRKSHLPLQIKFKDEL